MDAIKQLFATWMPDGKITAAALGGAIALIVLIVWDPGWEEWQYAAVVFASAIIAGYLMPTTLPWNKTGTDPDD